MLWITFIGWLARLIFLVLILLSVWSISIILERRKYYKTIVLPGLDDKAKIRLKQVSQLADGSSFIKDLFSEMNKLKSSESIEKAFEVFISEKKIELEKGLPILGTMGSTTPFIGLLGTVLGIIVSFGELSQGTGSTDAVMFSLAEALVLTAMGLVVAIPAVVFFNFYSRKVRAILIEISNFKNLYIAYRD